MTILTRRTVLMILAAHVCVALPLLAPRYIRPDSVGTCSWIRSVVVDGDFIFFDEWAGFRMIADGYPQFKEVTSVGALANHWGAGAAVLASPQYVMAHLVSIALPGPWFPDDGFYGLDLMTLGWSAVLFGALAAMFAWSTLMEIAPGYDPRMVAVVIALAYIGTPLFWYVYRMPLGTHAAGAVSVGAFVFLGARLLRGRRVSGMLFGLVLGLCALCRLQHSLLTIPLIWMGMRTKQPRRFWLSLAAGVSIPAAIQAVGWWSIYGTPFGPIVSGAVASGATWMPFRRISLIPVLVSPWHGLLSWSPIVALSIAGMLVLAYRKPDKSSGDDPRAIGWMLILVFALELFANTTMDRYWWGGLSFGARRFVDLWVPFAIGLGTLLRTRWRRLVLTLSIAAAVWSTGLMISAATGSIDLSHYVGWGELARGALVAPWTARLGNIRSPMTDPGLALLTLVSLGLTAVIAAVTFRLLRRFAPERVVTAWLLIVLAVFAHAATRTRSHAMELRDSFGLDTAAARAAGPLIDQRSLVGLEIEWLEATGQTEEVRRDRAEIAVVDQTLQRLGVDAR